MTDLGLRPTLGGAAYVDLATFERERDRIFARSWLAVGLAVEVPRTGSYLTVQVAGEPIVCVRGADGVVRSFYNVCRHRGSTVCQEPSGSVGSYLRCPYHAWSYGLDGALVAAPQLRDMPELDRAGHGLVPVATEVWQGLIWCNLDPGAAPLAETVGVAAARRFPDRGTLDRWEIGRLALGARRSYDVAANWKLLLENFMECYHCSAIHPELTKALPSFRTGLGTQNNPEGYADFAPSMAGFSLTGRAHRPRLPGLTDDDDRRYRGMTLAPSVLINLLPDHVIVHRFTPVATDRTTVVCDWLFDPGVVAAADFDASDSVDLFDAVNRQDFEACERCQANMGSRGFAAGGVLVPTEHNLEDFYGWVRSALA